MLACDVAHASLLVALKLDDFIRECIYSAGANFELNGIKKPPVVRGYKCVD